MKTFYWHDYETSGTHPALDRPLQFAGQRTDEALNPVGEPLVIFCKPAPESLPHPQACLITGITPQQALAEGVNEADFIAAIHRQLAQPGTCGVGYNSIRFDDEFSRYTLYRNFYDPYAREWQHGNSRWDLIDVVRMTYALRPQGINWPQGANGQPSFKLELLTQANGISHESAHDALSDVEATIALARLIRDRQPKLFDYAYKQRSKHEAGALLDVRRRSMALHISSRYPASQGCAALVAPLAHHVSNKNAVIVYDLAVDPAPLLALSAEEIRQRLYTPKDQLGEGLERIPLKQVHINRSPMLVTPDILQQSGYQRLGLDRESSERHASILQGAGRALVDKVREVFSQPHPAGADVDTQLYDGFFGNADRDTMVQVRQSSPTDLARGGFNFEDQRLSELLFRYRARNFPDSLSDEEREKWARYCQRRLREPEAGATITLQQFTKEILDKLAEPGVSGSDESILKSLLAHGEQISGDNLTALLGQGAKS